MRFGESAARAGGRNEHHFKISDIRMVNRQSDLHRLHGPEVAALQLARDDQRWRRGITDRQVYPLLPTVATPLSRQPSKASRSFNRVTGMHTAKTHSRMETMSIHDRGLCLIWTQIGRTC